MMFDLILEVMNGFSAKIGSIVPLGRGYFLHHPRHFVPGYYRAVTKYTRPPRLYLVYWLNRLLIPPSAVRNSDAQELPHESTHHRRGMSRQNGDLTQ
jgi:hypothetical protein